jgi:hypothetical protein
MDVIDVIDVTDVTEKIFKNTFVLRLKRLLINK